MITKCCMCNSRNMVEGTDTLFVQGADGCREHVVPAQKCQDCGEAYFSYEVLAQLEQDGQVKTKACRNEEP